MKDLKITANQYLVLKIINEKFNSTHMILTVVNDIIPNLPNSVYISKNTLYDCIRKLWDLNIIKYKNINWHWYEIKKWKEYYDVNIK